MERSCITSYIIIGNMSDIRYLHNSLLKLSQRKKTSLKHLAEMFYPEIKNYDIAGYFYDLQKNNSREIRFSVKTGAMPHPEIWFHICRKYLTAKIYYFAQEPNSGNYRTNDCAGHYFPQRYIVEDAGGNVNAVVAQQHLYEQVAGIIPVSEPYTTLEAFAKAIKAKLAGNRIFDILVVDNRGKCISHDKNLICQWL
ncbi:hypothetical protein [Dysgonomonas termitidis]|uniref:Uncharacterized protein n=1 Tax=Dysgonomonas termitidis TaxID=1516126 RepID=A0ABV9KR88_9BACT